MKAPTFRGDRLLAELKAQGISQTALANQTGVRRAHINDLIKGRHDASLDIALKIAIALNLSLDWLTGRTDIKNS